VHGLYMGAYVRLHAVVDQPVVPDLAVLIGERFYEEAATFSAAFDPSLDDLMLESGGQAAGWLVFDVPGRHGQLVLRDPDKHTIGVWTY
jgi:hypothetical protein